MPQLRTHLSERNQGHGPTLLKGLSLSRGEHIFQMDSDAQFDPSEFSLLWEHRTAGDLILGVRRQRHDPLHRLALTRVVRVAVSFLARKNIRDGNIPFRLISRDLWERLAKAIPPGSLAPSIMVSIGAARLGYNVIQVPITHFARPSGRSTLRLLGLIRFSLTALREVVNFARGLDMSAPTQPWITDESR